MTTEPVITNREHLHYLAGSYLIALVANVGIGLASDAKWKTVLGTTLISGLLLYVFTVKEQYERRKNASSTER